MSPDFKIIYEEINGNVDITANTQINNLRADKVVVSENVKARLFGTIKKTLVLKKGSVVILHGTIYGDVKNEGGELSLYQKEV